MKHNTVETANELKALWREMIPAPLPSDRQFELWASIFDEDTARLGLMRLALKFKKLGGQMNEDYRIKFASSIMNGKHRERSGQQARSDPRVTA